MEKLQIYRTALDALYFLLYQMPENDLTESTKVVLRHVVSVVLSNMEQVYGIDD